MSHPPRPAPLEQPSPKRPEHCPVEDWLAFLGHRWNALILWHLKEAPLRNGELIVRLPGITAKVLAERLAGLEDRALIAREELATFPRGVRYRLTERGEGVIAILDQFELWVRTSGEYAAPLR